MLAPIDKIRRRGNDIIQIVITTACDRNCSNCTQLLPFRTDYRFMSIDCFRAAVESLRDWPGVVALFGGNPCVHPKFPEFCRILAEIIPPAQRGLWTNNLFKHGAVAAETFGRGRLNLNAHGNAEAAAGIEQWFPGQLIAGSDRQASWHSTILANYRDLGISEQEWVAKRERCDINQKWSAAIVERDGKPFAYFCEVAAAIDGIRGENSGVPAIPGWWQQRMPAFDSQVRNCCDRGCGVPLKLRGHLDCDDTYDLSPSWASIYKGQNVNTEILKSHPETCTDAADYLRRWTE
jgi:hypothetical protein